MKKWVFLFVIVVIIIFIGLFFQYWLTTQPVAVVTKKIDTNVLPVLPGTNKKIIDFVELHGKEIAPTYETAVCTEFIIEVINNVTPLSKQEKKLIRIITTENLANLVRGDSSIIKGVQTALLCSNKGIRIERPEDVRPGDFVQFWSVYNNSAYGHCGVVLALEAGKNITVYSSHPLTSGYGKQRFLWPDKLFFVRLK